LLQKTAGPVAVATFATIVNPALDAASFCNVSGSIKPDFTQSVWVNGKKNCQIQRSNNLSLCLLF